MCMKIVTNNPEPALLCVVLSGVLRVKGLLLTSDNNNPCRCLLWLVNCVSDAV